jgi:hypothetical protein
MARDRGIIDEMAHLLKSLETPHLDIRRNSAEHKYYMVLLRGR